jgi:hypothetical protein
MLAITINQPSSRRLNLGLALQTQIREPVTTVLVDPDTSRLSADFRYHREPLVAFPPVTTSEES